MTDGADKVATVGLIGWPVEHSLSPTMHNAAFAELGLPYRYILLPTPPNELEGHVREYRAQGLAGWNITVPHKEGMAKLLDDMSDDVKAIGACNTVRVEKGRLHGFNTDTIGFMRGLDEAGGIEADSKAVLLGAGGAARGVAWALKQAGHEILILSRKPEQAAILAEQLGGLQSGTFEASTLTQALKDAALLVNCTPTGMWPNTEQNALPEAVQLRPNLLVYDLVYKPRPTVLLQQASQQGCRTQDGLAMLVHQGAAAFQLWTNHQAPIETMRQACLAATIDD